MSNRSHTRLKAIPAGPPVPELRLATILLSNDPNTLALVRAAAPKSMCVRRAGDFSEIAAGLADFPVIAAVVVDMAVPISTAKALLEPILQRWPEAERLALQSGRSSKSPSTGYELADHCVFLAQDADLNVRRIAAFLRKALDLTLVSVGQLLMFAHRRNMSPATVEAYVVYLIRQVPRTEISTVLGVSESAVRRRFEKLSGALGDSGRLSELTQALAMRSPRHPPARYLVALETAALELDGRLSNASGEENR